MPDVFFRRHESLEAALGFSLVTIYINENVRRTAVLGQMDGSHAHQPDARVGEFAFDKRFDFLAQSFAQPAAMMLNPAPFHIHSEVKRLRISENTPPMLARKCHCGAETQKVVSTEVTRGYEPVLLPGKADGENRLQRPTTPLKCST
jgi:hypothetical protein